MHFLDKTIPEVQLTISHSKDKKIYAQKKNTILESVQSFKETAEELVKNYNIHFIFTFSYSSIIINLILFYYQFS